ncbi:unnamed protein product [Lactuca virosa]|uniref:DUF569 domain-containing protein n=1 Tax=Lactuca virosa TaxID=75947 RepID=A0AAU9MJK5_9ASTR|nr:unnamed protein product [Lactuca virosa]
MELFRKAKSVRLKSHHDKYILAESNDESVLQDRNETTKKGIWMVEFVEGFDNVLQLKSSYGKYLTASEDQVIIGFTGRKVVQSMHQRLDSSIEWEPIRDGFQVRLKTRYRNYLQANGGLPPWRNSVTHDIPYRHHDWILWDIETMEARPEEPSSSSPLFESINPNLNSSSFSLRSSISGPTEGNDPPAAKKEGMMVYYMVVDDDRNVDDGYEETSFAFEGHGLEDLILNLEEQTWIDDIIVCSRNPLNGKLFPLWLALSPKQLRL